MSMVVIVGRMNVGKSTLFNRLAKNARSITLDYEGVTRDFIKDRIEWAGKSLDLIDSGGITLRRIADPLLEQVRKKVLDLIEKADVIIFMTDGIVGLLPEEQEISKLLHKLGKKVVVAVNKIDNSQAQQHIYEFEKLGHQACISISAQHGRGINDLLDQVVALLPHETQKAPDAQPQLRVVLLGRPNAGKSSLMNLLLQEERSIVSDIPGTTREAITESVMFYKQAIQVTDTPGIRRQKAVTGELEPLMVKSAFHALRDADIIVLLIDGADSVLVDQELKLAFYAYAEHYKGLILLVNKQDLMTEADKLKLEENFNYYKHLIKRIPVLYISCATGKNVGRVLPTIQKVWDRYSYTFDNSKLHTLLLSQLQKKPLYHLSQRLLVYEVEQVRTAPPTILLKVNMPEWFGESQLRFFENLIQSEYDMIGVPIKFIVKKHRETKGRYHE
jgi:GTPase